MTARVGIYGLWVHMAIYLVKVAWNGWGDATCQGLDVTLCGSPALTAVDALSLDFSGNLIQSLNQAKNAVVEGLTAIGHLIFVNYEIFDVSPDQWGFQVMYPIVLLIKAAMVMWFVAFLLMMALSLLGRGIF